MSLYDSMLEDCTLLDKTTVNDGVFGRVDTYVPGARFKATIVKDDTTETRLAERQGVKEGFVISTAKGFGLTYHDVFRREKDGEIFRVTSNQKDSEVPAMSSIQMGKVTAERWEIPS